MLQMGIGSPGGMSARQAVVTDRLAMSVLRCPLASRRARSPRSRHLRARRFADYARLPVSPAGPVSPVGRVRGGAMTVRTDCRPDEREAATPGDNPHDEAMLDESTAAEHIHGICLKTGPPRRVGVELEWLVRDASDPALPVPAERIATAVAAFGAGQLPSSASPGVLPSGALLTAEPGGQLELS